MAACAAKLAAALAESLVLVLVCAKAAPALEDASPRTQTAALVAVLAFCALAIVYVTLKPYPFDLVDGVPLVDPEEMRLDAYKGVGFLAGIAVAWFAERHLVGFADPTSRRQRLVRLALGVVVTAATYLASLFISLAVPDAVGAFLRGAAPMLGGVFLAPAAFSRLERALERNAA